MPRTTSKNGADPSGEGTRRLDEVGPLELRPTGHPEGTVDDYLCLRPRGAGVWYSKFDESIHLGTADDFMPNWSV